MRKFMTMSNGKCQEIKPFWPCPGTNVFHQFYRMVDRSNEEDPCRITEEVGGYYCEEFNNKTDKQLLKFFKGDKKVFDAIVKYGNECEDCDTNWKAFNSALVETIARYVDFQYPVEDSD